MNNKEKKKKDSRRPAPVRRSDRVERIIGSRPPLIIRHGSWVIAVIYVVLMAAVWASGILSREPEAEAGARAKVELLERRESGGDKDSVAGHEQSLDTVKTLNHADSIERAECHASRRIGIRNRSILRDYGTR